MAEPVASTSTARPQRRSRSASSSLSQYTVSSPSNAGAAPSRRTSASPSSSSLGFSSDSDSQGGGNDSYDELSEGDSVAPAATTGNKRKRGGKAALPTGVYDPSTLTIAHCQWADCGKQFYELEPLIEHLHTTHAFPINPQDLGTKKALIYVCDWTGCPRRGKNQTSKFALLGHLRSHTGEKPFNCPRPECDKSFTRTDALQKHMRIQHGETIISAAKKASTNPSKKRKGGARASSVGSEMGDDDDAGSMYGGEGAAGGGDEGEESWAADELAAFEENPHLPRPFVAYVLAKAKWSYLIREHEGLAAECEALEVREAGLKGEVGSLLGAVLRKEVGKGAPVTSDTDVQEVEDNANDLERFLHAYSHQPLKMPTGWNGVGGK